MRGVALGVAAAAMMIGSAAAAAPDGQDPPALVDRTLWLPACVTELASTFSTRAHYWSNGSRRQAIFDGLELALDARHSFGVIEPFVGVSALLARGEGDSGRRRLLEIRAGVRVPITAWGAALLTARRRSPLEDDIVTSMDASVEARMPFDDHHAALDVTAGGGVRHLWLRVPPMGDLTPVWFYTSTNGYAFASATGTVQPSPVLALGVGLRVDVIGADFGSTYKALDAHAQALIALGHVDLMARMTLGDVTGDYATKIQIDVGVAARF